MDPRIKPFVGAWDEVTRRIGRAAARLSDADWEARSACGAWSNRELLAHLATGYVVRIARLERALHGTVVPPIDVDRANAENVARLASAPIHDVLSTLHESRARVRALIESLTHDALVLTFEVDGVSRPLHELLWDNSHDLEHLAEFRPAAG